MAKKSSHAVTMDDLLEDSTVPKLESGEIIQGKVMSAEKHEVWLDLGSHGLGLVTRKEIGAHQLEEGDEVSASVLEPETEEGFAVLSLRRAAKDKGWDILRTLQSEEETVKLKAYDANRGGLLVEVEGIRGFLPVSHLAPKHYPRVSGADKDEILQRLNQLVGKELEVRILDLDKKDNKLIVSEKLAKKEKLEERLDELKVGETVEGVVTGVVDFGAFINVNGIEGLIHISEISWDRVDDPRNYLSVDDKVEAKIIAIDQDKLSLSLKQLEKDPWSEEIQNYSVGDKVKGTVTRITPFGAFIQISPAIEALVHISELGDDENTDPEEVFKLDEEKEFTIIDIDTEGRKISLSLNGDSTGKKKTKKKKKKKTKKKTEKKASKKSDEKPEESAPSEDEEE